MDELIIMIGHRIFEELKLTLTSIWKNKASKSIWKILEKGFSTLEDKIYHEATGIKEKCDICMRTKKLMEYYIHTYTGI